VFINQRLRFFLTEADGEHFSFAAGTTFHELCAQRRDPRALF
jgi:hypothetical protein